MKKALFLMTGIAAMVLISWSVPVIAQDDTSGASANTPTATAPDQPAASQQEPVAESPQEKETFHQAMKTKFIEGGVPYMVPILLCMIFGLAIIIERIIYLNLASTNTNKLLKKIEDALFSGGVDSAKDVCRNARGPVASIFYQGLDRFDEGIEVVEKSVVSYGGVQMGLLERGMVWVSLFIALAPMLGFFGTVVGMVQAFDDIAKAGDISPTIVAGGIKVALITTVFGLIVAMVLQVFYNYLIAKIDTIVGAMEDSSISLIDMLVKFNKSKK